MPDKSTIGTNQGSKPQLTGEPVISHEDEASAGPHDTDHQAVVINVNTKEE